MKDLRYAIALCLVCSGWAGTAAADPWKDESGNGRWRGGWEHGDDGWRERSRGYYREGRRERHGYKEEYRRGGCKVERKWDGDEYKEEVKCKRGWRGPYRYHGY